MCDQHPPGGARDRIQPEEGLVREAGQRKGRQHGVAAGRAHGGGDVPAQPHIDRLAEQIQERSRPGGDQDDPNHRESPHPGRRQDGPAEEQHQGQCSRYEAPAKIVEDLPAASLEAGLAPEELRVPRPIRPGQAHGHAWLKDGVPLIDSSFVPVVVRPVQRVRHGPHELPRRIAWELRIRVQRDHVLHARKDGDVAHDEGKAISRPSSQKRIQIRKLSPFPLVAHPRPLPGIPAAGAMKQKKEIAV